MPKTNLPREYFIAPDVFERETEQVFSRHWVCAGHASEFPAPPSYRIVEIGDYSIVVARSSATEWSAFHNVCRHRGARICTQSQGVVGNASLTCPYHAWTYDLQGRLIGAPNMSQVEGFDRDDYPLGPVAAAEWNGLVMLRLGEGQASFVDDYKPVIERLTNWLGSDLTLVDTLRYHVRANWKVIFQNYSECYHCPTVHPSLSQLTPYKSATNDLIGGPFLGGPMELDEGVETVSADGRRVGRGFPRLTSNQRSHVYYYTLFPSLFVSAHPDYLMVHVLQRRCRDATDVACHFFTPRHEGDAEANLSRAVQMWDEVNRQDWKMCELTQLGAQSPAFRPGPYSSLESMVAAFDRYYLEVMAQSSD